MANELRALTCRSQPESGGTRSDGKVKLYWSDARMLTARRPMLPIVSGEARTLGGTRTRLATWMPRLILLAAGAYFVVMAGRWIASPGLEYDELLFVNAATGEPTNGM